MDELNDLLEEKCRKYLSHHIQGKPRTVGEMFEEEKEELYPLPAYSFDMRRRTYVRVDRFCTVRFDTNNYSVPCAYCGKEVSVCASPERVSRIHFLIIVLQIFSISAYEKASVLSKNVSKE